MGWSALTIVVDVAYDEDFPRVQELLEPQNAFQNLQCRPERSEGDHTHS